MSEIRVPAGRGPSIARYVVLTAIGIVAINMLVFVVFLTDRPLLIVGAFVGAAFGNLLVLFVAIDSYVREVVQAATVVD